MNYFGKVQQLLNFAQK